MIHNRYFRFKDIQITNHGDYVLIGVSNLETGSATKRKVEYASSDGVVYRDILYNERAFEISGIIHAENSETMVRLKRKLISACSLKESFRMHYCNRENKYSAECYFDKLPTFGTRKGWWLPFKLYVTIPGFYWQSGHLREFNLFAYQDELTDTFTLPCVFTSLVNNAEIINSGDVDAFPVFTIKCNATASGGVAIKHDTTGKRIKLNYTPIIGEEITVDTYNQMITSNIKGNITGKITLDSDFFSLQVGENKISCDSIGCLVKISFYENYLGV